VNAIDVDLSLAAVGPDGMTPVDHTITVAGAGVLDIVGHVSGGAAGSNLVKGGAGELVFVSDYNGYLNNTLVQEGTLTALGQGGTGDPTRSGMVVDGVTTLNLRQRGFAEVGSLSGSGSVVLGPGNALDMGADNTSTEFSGVICGGGYIYKQGTGPRAPTPCRGPRGGHRGSGRRRSACTTSAVRSMAAARNARPLSAVARAG
jgi:hypothetical protein